MPGISWLIGVLVIGYVRCANYKVSGYQPSTHQGHGHGKYGFSKTYYTFNANGETARSTSSFNNGKTKDKIGKVKYLPGFRYYTYHYTFNVPTGKYELESIDVYPPIDGKNGKKGKVEGKSNIAAVLPGHNGFIHGNPGKSMYKLISGNQVFYSKGKNKIPAQGGVGNQGQDTLDDPNGQTEDAQLTYIQQLERERKAREEQRKIHMKQKGYVDPNEIARLTGAIMAADAPSNEDEYAQGDVGYADREPYDNRGDRPSTDGGLDGGRDEYTGSHQRGDPGDSYEEIMERYKQRVAEERRRQEAQKGYVRPEDRPEVEPQSQEGGNYRRDYDSEYAEVLRKYNERMEELRRERERQKGYVPPENRYEAQEGGFTREIGERDDPEYQEILRQWRERKETFRREQERQKGYVPPGNRFQAQEGNYETREVENPHPTYEEIMRQYEERKREFRRQQELQKGYVNPNSLQSQEGGLTRITGDDGEYDQMLEAHRQRVARLRAEQERQKGYVPPEELRGAEDRYLGQERGDPGRVSSSHEQVMAEYRQRVKEFRRQQELQKGYVRGPDDFQSQEGGYTREQGPDVDYQERLRLHQQRIDRLRRQREREKGYVPPSRVGSEENNYQAQEAADPVYRDMLQSHKQKMAEMRKNRKNKQYGVQNDGGYMAQEKANPDRELNIDQNSYELMLKEHRQRKARLRAQRESQEIESKNDNRYQALELRAIDREYERHVAAERKRRMEGRKNADKKNDSFSKVIDDAVKQIKKPKTVRELQTKSSKRKSKGKSSKSKSKFSKKSKRKSKSKAKKIERPNKKASPTKVTKTKKTVKSSNKK